MACVARLQELLKARGFAAQCFEHAATATAEAAALSGHVRARRLARAHVMRDAAGDCVMLVLPASERLDRATACRVLGTARLTPLPAGEWKQRFPDCEPGAAPPFGALYGMPAVLDLCFFEAEAGEADGDIYFEAGNHRELVAMRFEDYRRAAGPFAHEACLHLRPRPAHTVKHGGRGAL